MTLKAYTYRAHLSTGEDVHRAIGCPTTDTFFHTQVTVCSGFALFALAASTEVEEP